MVTVRTTLLAATVALGVALTGSAAAGRRAGATVLQVNVLVEYEPAVCHPSIAHPCTEQPEPIEGFDVYLTFPPSTRVRFSHKTNTEGRVSFDHVFPGSLAVNLRGFTHGGRYGGNWKVIQTLATEEDFAVLLCRRGGWVATVGTPARSCPDEGDPTVVARGTANAP